MDWARRTATTQYEFYLGSREKAEEFLKADFGSENHNDPADPLNSYFDQALFETARIKKVVANSASDSQKWGREHHTIYVEYPCLFETRQKPGSIPRLYSSKPTRA